MLTDDTSFRALAIQNKKIKKHSDHTRVGSHEATKAIYKGRERSRERSSSTTINFDQLHYQVRQPWTSDTKESSSKVKESTMKFTIAIPFLIAFVTGAAADDCKKGLHYCGSTLMKLGTPIYQLPIPARIH